MREIARTPATRLESGDRSFEALYHQYAATAVLRSQPSTNATVTLVKVPTA